jgi:predicted O-methyltransferase YrrM
MTGQTARDTQQRPSRWYEPVPDSIRRYFTGDTAITGMFGMESGSALYSLARDRIAKETRIVDAGTFLGKSTACLARGVVDSEIVFEGNPPIVSYDRFRHYGGEATGVYDQFLRAFIENVSEYLEYIDVRQGDFSRVHWDGDAIALMFIDIAKSEQLHSRCVTHFFPYLAGEGAIVFQQDFHHPWLPHIPIQMQKLGAYFDILEEKVNDSCIFVLRKSVPAWITEKVVQPMETDEKFGLLDEMISRFAVENRSHLYLVKLVLTVRARGRAKAQEFYDETIRPLGDLPGDPAWLRYRSQVEKRFEIARSST